MNKKVFTLLTGALILIGSSFTASAQQNPLPYTPGDPSSFSDILTADTAAESFQEKAHYLLSVTGLANSSRDTLWDLLGEGYETKHAPDDTVSSVDSSYVLYVSGDKDTKDMFLRIENIAKLDTAQGYNFEYGCDQTSTKIGAIRRASWCGRTSSSGDVASNIVFDFTNMETGKDLAVSYDGVGDSINAMDEELLIKQWHFSQSTDKLQTGMPLYSYVTRDTVAVLVLKSDTSYQEPDNKQGGWFVTFKRVAIDDLIQDHNGNVRLVDGVNGEKPVEDVLLFTLKTLNPFTMNANDFNALNFTFDKDPNLEVTNEDKPWFKYTNPFTDNAPTGACTNVLEAVMVNDSLYQHGYMQFQYQGTIKGKDNEDWTDPWLYVDTAFVNYGTHDNFLAFAWSKKRRDSTLTGFQDTSKNMLWGDSHDSLYYYSLSRDSIFWTKMESELGRSLQGPDSLLAFQDSIAAQITWHADSIMENQSKFRVVYDPYQDEVSINVYQSRVRHQENAPWWTNSFYPDTSGTFTLPDGTQILDTIKRPSEFNISGGSIVDTCRASLRDKTIEDIMGGNWNSPHSFMSQFNSPFFLGGHMDKVMISTADTSVVNAKYENDRSAMAHLFGCRDICEVFRDSVLYVDLQDIGSNRIITIDQRCDDDHLKIETSMPKCQGGDDPDRGQIDNDLYLIRNKHGEYLCVPIWSAQDSVYWVTPNAYEDPTRMPSYQWAVIGNPGSTFRMTNREFEKVEFDYVYVYEDGSTPFHIGGEYSGSKFNTKNVFGKATATTEAVGYDDWGKDGFTVENGKYNDVLDEKYPFSEYGFVRLNSTVKSDQKLGYHYMNPDSTMIDVYALKYLHFTTLNEPRYLSWNGYDVPKTDSLVYAQATNYYDKLYFHLDEMEDDYLYPVDEGDDHENGRLVLTSTDNSDFEKLYEELTSHSDKYTTGDSVVLERFGVNPEALKGEIKDLKPMARQAYRFFLKDPYRWHPTVQGDYMTVGQQDNYILADRRFATQPYVSGSGNVEGLFGIPHFYFRNTYFDVTPADGGDYFALVQRVDTGRIDREEVDLKYKDYQLEGLAELGEYLTLKFGSLAAEQVVSSLKSNEYGVFVAQVADNSAKLKMVLRGDAAVRVSTFQLKHDNDPVYRRFHVNEPAGNFSPELKDTPDTLQFHYVNQGEEGYRLYENQGNPSAGGHMYNKDENGEFVKDAGIWGHNEPLSFLGVNNSAQFGDKTNYALFADTAYINRGTGWIKPQYLLVVDPYTPEEDCKVCVDGGWKDEVNNGRYTIGRYMYNTAMYAKAVPDRIIGLDDEWDDTDKVYPIEWNAKGETKDGRYLSSDNFNKVQPIDEEVVRTDGTNKAGEAYMWSSKFERFGFAWAIHKGDSLYVLKGVEPFYGENLYNDPHDLFMALSVQYGEKGKYIDFDKLIEENTVEGGGYDEAYYPRGDMSAYPDVRPYRTFRDMDAVKADKKTIGLHAIIDLGDNTHKDWVYSFRYIERNASDFVIESETTDRRTDYGKMILPGYGGWLKVVNHVPVVSRTDIHEIMGQAEGTVFNVERLNNPVNNDAVEEEVASEVAVIGGTGVVNILHAAGKKVVISNVLGQTVVNTVLSSDNAALEVPTGIVVVAVEGEDAVKALVK